MTEFGQKKKVSWFLEMRKIENSIVCRINIQLKNKRLLSGKSIEIIHCVFNCRS